MALSTWEITVTCKQVTICFGVSSKCSRKYKCEISNQWHRRSSKIVRFSEQTMLEDSAFISRQIKIVHLFICLFIYLLVYHLFIRNVENIRTQRTVNSSQCCSWYRSDKGKFSLLVVDFFAVSDVLPGNKLRILDHVWFSISFFHSYLFFHLQLGLPGPSGELGPKGYEVRLMWQSSNSETLNIRNGWCQLVKSSLKQIFVPCISCCYPFISGDLPQEES